MYRCWTRRTAAKRDVRPLREDVKLLDKTYGCCGRDVADENKQKRSFELDNQNQLRRVCKIVCLNYFQ